MLKNNKWYIWVLIMAIVMLHCTSCMVYGYSSRVDVQRAGSLTVSFQSAYIACEGMRFQLYYVANISDTAQFVLTEPFQGIEVTFQNLSQDEWKELAQNLSNYILKVKTKIEPLAIEKTNNKGEVMFSDLPTGLYLVVGEGAEDGNTTISPVPFLVSLPSRNEEQEWQYDMNAIVKYTLQVESEPFPSTGERGGIILLLALVGSGIAICFLAGFGKNTRYRDGY